ncbi:hypothetical protein ACLB2K_054323 [Fragaria x ananassa]
MVAPPAGDARAVCPWPFLNSLGVSMISPQPPPQASKAKTFASVLSGSVESSVTLSQLPVPGSSPMKLHDLKTSLASLWKISSPWRLVPLGKGYFDIHFNTEEDMRRVWGGGTCTLASGLFRLSQWQPDFKPGDALRQTHSQIWVRLYGLSQDYWHPQHLMEIARGVGTPLQLDKATKEREFGYFARVLVNVDLAGNLPSSLMVERETHCFPIDVVVVEGSKHPKPVIRQEYRVKNKPSAQQSLPTKSVSDVGITQFVDQALKEVVDNELDRIAGLVINEPMEPSANRVNDSVLNGNKFSVLHENVTEVMVENDKEVIVENAHEKGDGFVIENVHNTHLVAGNISMNVSAGHVNEVDEDDEDYDDNDDSSIEEIYEDGSGPNNHSLERTYNSPQSQSWHDTVVEDQFINQTEVFTGAVPPGFEHVGVLAKDVSLITSHVEKGVLMEDDFVKALSKSQKKKQKQQAKHVAAAAASEGPYPKRDRKKNQKYA